MQKSRWSAMHYMHTAQRYYKNYAKQSFVNKFKTSKQQKFSTNRKKGTKGTVLFGPFFKELQKEQRLTIEPLFHI